jgi:hypothetical protein
MSPSRCTRCRKRGHKGLDCPDRKPSTMCRYCFDMSHRRPKDGCLGCFRPYVAEVVEAALSRRESPIVAMESW